MRRKPPALSTRFTCSLITALVAVSCSKSDNGTTSTCPLAASTTATSTVTSGCALLTRDTSSCASSRMAQGLSGAWLKFSCRVTLTKQASSVQLTTDSRPDYKSNYFASTDACYEAYTPPFPDPGSIAAQNIVMTVPLSPAISGSGMGLGVVGVAVNGVSIFNNVAAPGDDIYTESKSFDRCQGHPAGTKYHYHSEPYAISYDDANLIGVLRDGYFVYGRKDSDGSTPTLDSAGGHTGVTADSNGAAVYHYHTNLQTSTTTGTAGQTAWFLTTGSYKGTPGSCTGC